MPASNPFLAFHNLLDAAGTITASSTSYGSADNLRDWRPYTQWSPSSLPATVTIDLGSASSAIIAGSDYMALFNHNLFSACCSVEAHSSTDNFAANDVTLTSVTPASNKPLISQYTKVTSRYLRLLIDRAIYNLYQNELDNAYWLKSVVDVTANTATAPDSTVTSDTITDNSAAIVGQIYKDFTPNIIELDFNSTLVATAYVLKDAVPASTRFPSLRITFYTKDGLTHSYSVRLDTSTGAISHGDSAVAGDVAVSDATTHWKITVSKKHTSPKDVLYVRIAFLPSFGSGALTSAANASLTGSAGLWGFSLSAADMPVLSIAAIGEGLEMPTGLPYGIDPLARKVFGQTNISEQGLPLGKAIMFEQWSQTLTFKYLDSAWLRSTFMPAWKSSLRGKPFLFAFNLTSYPDEIYLVEAGDTVKAAQELPTYSTLSFDVKGAALP